MISGCSTTRIFCRPNCPPGRRTRPRNRVTFTTLAAAQAAGYRPCKVCRPLEEPFGTPWVPRSRRAAAGKTTFATLCYVRENGRVLLQHKAQDRFGGGKWNGPGGKLRPGESPQEGVVREVEEETGLRICDPHHHGILYFLEGEPARLSIVAHVFSAPAYDGRLCANDEGELRWFGEEEIPYDAMWPDDRYWLPHLLAGEDFDAVCWFDEGLRNLLRYEVLVKRPVSVK